MQNTMTVRQIATAAGDPHASAATAGRYTLRVVTAGGKTREVAGVRSASFGGLVLQTSKQGSPVTVERVAAAAGAYHASADDAQYGNVQVTVRTPAGKIRPVIRASFNGNSVVLTTGK